jgi:hypothetical protein
LLYQKSICDLSPSSQTQIDFWYNKKKQWGKVQEVGGDGSSKGLKERLEALFKK